ncbi:MAG: alpha/beta fold hydrolase BchO [Pseudomonadota bacterium]
MSNPLDWNREGRLWPHREASTFIKLGKARWHVQQMGAGEPVLLLHGTGGSVHSWRGLMPLLAKDHQVIAVDLPRHAFTTGHVPEDMSLPRMARTLADLLDTLEITPSAVVGHSAGAALALQMALDHRMTGPIIGLNSAVRPFPGPAAQIFPAIAKVLFVNPFVPRVFSGAAAFPGEAERFLFRATGSRLQPADLACYRALLRNPRHTKGALAMMANWDLPSLRERMSEVTNPIKLIHSDKDAAIPLDWAREAHSWLPTSSLDVLEGYGHLAHEEAPDRAASLVRGLFAEYESPTLGNTARG